MKIGYLKASASDEFGREGLYIGSHGCYKTSVGMTTSVIFFWFYQKATPTTPGTGGASVFSTSSDPLVQCEEDKELCFV